MASLTLRLFWFYKPPPHAPPVASATGSFGECWGTPGPVLALEQVFERCFGLGDRGVRVADEAVGRHEREKFIRRQISTFDPDLATYSPMPSLYARVVDAGRLRPAIPTRPVRRGRPSAPPPAGFPACLAPRVPVYSASVGTPPGPRRTTEPFAASAKVAFPKPRNFLERRHVAGLRAKSAPLPCFVQRLS